MIRKGNDLKLPIHRTATTGDNNFTAGWLTWFFFFGSVFFFMANLFAAVAVFPSYSLTIGSSPFQAGLQNTVFGVTAVLIRFYLGPVMDDRGAKPLMLLGAFTFATAPLLLLLSPSYSLLMAARIYQSLGLAVFLPGMYTLTAEMAPPGRIGTYLGALRIFFNVGLLAGPSIALLIIGSLGYYSWFVVSGLTSLLTLALLAAVRTPANPVRAAKKTSSLRQVLEALTVKQIYPIIGGIALFAFTYSAVVSFAAVHIEEAAPEMEAAYFFVAFGTAGITACLGVGALSDRFGRQQVAWPMMIILGIGAALFYCLPVWPGLVIVCAVILGIGIQGSSLVFAAWLIEISRPHLRTTTISLQENSIDIFFALGAMAFGLAAQGPGLGSAFLAAGIVTIIAVLPLRKLSAYLIDNDINH